MSEPITTPDELQQAATAFTVGVLEEVFAALEQMGRARALNAEADAMDAIFAYHAAPSDEKMAALQRATDTLAAWRLFPVAIAEVRETIHKSSEGRFPADQAPDLTAKLVS